MRRRCLLILLLFVFGTLLSACSDTFCSGSAIASARVEVRDAQGNPAALGATVTLDGPLDYQESEIGFSDDPFIWVGRVEGPFSLHVSKPYYSSATVHNVMPPTDACGVSAAAEVAVTLRREANAPHVQQVVVGGPRGMVRATRSSSKPQSLPTLAYSKR